VDTRVREIAEVLRQRGIWDRTLLVVTGDHGENLGEHHLLGHKFVLYDTLLRVPLLLRCPPCVPQGFVIEDLAQTTDVLPTILELLGIEDDAAKLQGRALLEEGRATRGPDFTIAECFRPNLSTFQRRFPEFDTRPYDVRQRAIRTRRDKFIWHSDEGNELYDLATDPGEDNNLVDSDSARADALRRQLFDWLADVEKFEPEHQDPELDDMMRQQLQGLGYIE
jgi:arylsulfatase A-like enzyme